MCGQSTETIVRLENWAVALNYLNPYMPPESSWTFLTGLVSGHPKHTDGKRIATSRIIKVSGKFVYTNSGTLYELGKPSLDYIEWCKSEGCHIPTEEEPIKQ